VLSTPGKPGAIAWQKVTDAKKISRDFHFASGLDHSFTRRQFLIQSTTRGFSAPILWAHEAPQRQ
jgi:hypothetical protein